MKTGAISNARRDGNDRALNQPGDHAGQSAFHAGHDNEDMGLLNFREAIEEAVQARNTDIVDALDGVAHDFGGHGGFFSDGNIAGAGGEDTNLPRMPRMGALADRDAASLFVVDGVRKFGLENSGVLRGDAGDEEAAFALQEGCTDFQNLLRRFARAEDYFGETFAKGAMGVDLRELEVDYLRHLECMEDGIEVHLARTEFFQQLFGVVSRHTGTVPRNFFGQKEKVEEGIEGEDRV